MDKSKHIPKFIDGSMVSYSDFAYRWFSSFRTSYYFDSFFNDSIITDECRNPDSYVAVIEYADNNDDIFKEYTKKYRHLINCCRIFKPSKIGFSQSFSSFDNDSKIFIEDYAHIFPSAFFMINGDKFNLSEDEKVEFAKFFQDTYSHFPYTPKEIMGIDDKQSTSILPRMFNIFHQSFSVTDISTAAVLRTIVLEMLIEGNVELNNRLSRSIAVLLGKNIDHAIEIEDKIKKIYKARSKYVHDGKHIKKEEAELTLKMVCEFLKKIYTITDDIEMVRKKLHQSGFGNPPY